MCAPVQTRAAVTWSNANMPGKFCVGDGSNVSFVQDSVFDGAYSFAVVHHLPYDLQCRLVLEAIRIVKPGGFIYLGWFGHHVQGHPSKDPDGEFWPTCLRSK